MGGGGFARGGTDDAGHFCKGWHGKAKFPDHRVKRATKASMRPETRRHVKCSCVEFFGYGFNLVWLHKHENGFVIDETADQPRASDAINLGPMARDPQGVAVFIALDMGGRHQHLPVIFPGHKAAFQILNIMAETAQQCGNPLAELCTALAANDHRTAFGLALPIIQVLIVAVQACWEKSWV